MTSSAVGSSGESFAPSSSTAELSFVLQVSIGEVVRNRQTSSNVQMTASIFTAIRRFDPILGLCDRVTGGGSSRDEGDGLEYRFSLRLVRDGADIVELLDDVDDIDRLV